ncbi:MAG: hydroxyisourate hydrolase [Pseudonocardia sp.]|nr:hydroxyisourate hydrolase [Pseudonocardia sp.]
MSGLSTHVLDAALGRPASGLAVTVTAPDGQVHAAVTDADGRVATLLASPLRSGSYQIRFDTAGYFAATGQKAFYPEVTICFTVENGREHHHVPLLLSPFAYSTYRGS